ncbi:type I polyketide synthase [Nocardia uniformis]|uniref:type I polyketide synthase n=1 Tax=Nocardia uniformis TaxID=53432 RepID=UPI000833016C|nr:type I polyketide synthase [Nocardia uniformis]
MTNSESTAKLADALRASLKETDRLRARNRKLDAALREPIAIVGMACRYPGGVESPEDLWRLVSDGVDATTDFPTNRGWDIERIYDPTGEQPNRSYTRSGGFLHTAGEFDPAFFGISPNEAATMDPQQFLLLETSWEAFERAGIDPTTLRGSSTGVWTGMMYHDYPANANAGSLASGRISYTFGLEGPSITVDTACSSSLVAMHSAAQSLRSGECDLALAGGVTVMAGPDTLVEFSRQRGLSIDGRCKSFSESADGVGWAEGAGVLVLERLSDAQRNGHRILAVVAGSAVNSDGASNGLTAPNGPAQRRVITQALSNAGISAADVDAVEGHGTGTTLGDPIEAQALLGTYGRDRAPERPLWLGSLKSNIGHAQAAAGVGGVIKMVMAMRHETLPRTLHVDQPSTKVDWSAGDVRLLTEPVPWPHTDRPRRAGVSSFGISGTNAHIILEQPPREQTEHLGESSPRGTSANALREATASVETVMPWVLSAASSPALGEQAVRLRSHLRDNDSAPADVGYSLAATRATLDHRAVVFGADRDELLSGIEALGRGDSIAGVVSGRVVSGSTAFVFSGQGAQWAGMAQQLRTHPVFAAAFDTVVAELNPLLGQTVSLDEALTATDQIDQTVFAQAGLFAFEVALYRLLEAWGLRPNLVAGHSIGEIAAAHIAGVLSLSDACTLVAARGRLMQALPTGGAMVAVGAPESEVAPLLTDGVSIAAVNSPSSVVLSGVETAVAAVAVACAEKGWRTHRLRVSHAFHSELMEPMLAEFASVVEGLSFDRPTIPLVSTVTGARVTDEMSEPAYWVRQVRATVRFADAVTTMANAGVVRFAEVGPDAALTPMVAGTVDEGLEKSTVAVAVARRDEASAATVSAAAAALFVSGAEVDWTAFYAGTQPIDLPTYAFQHERFWLDAKQYLSTTWLGAETTGADVAGLDPISHPLLGAAVPQPDSGGVCFVGRWSVDSIGWLADHSVLGTVLLPGTGFVELATHVGGLIGHPVVDELILHTPLTLPTRDGVSVQVVVGGASDSGRRRLTIHSRQPDAGAWTLHAEGDLTAEEIQPDIDLTVWPPVGAETIDVADVYNEMLGAGYGYGPYFQGMRAMWRRGDELFAEVALPDSEAAAGYGLHPALFDAAMHAFIVHSIRHGGLDTPALPFSWNRVALHTTGCSAVRVRIRMHDNRFALHMADGTGTPVLSVGSLDTRPVSADRLRAGSVADALFTVEWIAATSAATGSVAPARTAIIGAPGSAAVRGYPDLTTLVAELDAAPESTVPELILFACSVTDDASPHAARDALNSALATIREWLGDTRFAESRLVVLTNGAVRTSDTDQVRPALAPVWGLIRAAQAEHPHRLQLLDLDGSADPDPTAVATAAAAIAAEPEGALRGENLLVPRLVQHRPTETPPLEPVRTGTVLITGGTGGLGALFARHLVTEYGVRQLVLTSRRGPEAPGAEALCAELTELGAQVTITACDVSDRDALKSVLDEIGPDYPLTGVVHAAGVADNGLIESMTSNRIDTVFAPKADAAWHLHELTGDRPLSLFVLVSSAGGLVLAAGQANYAAANVYLDALATYRRAAGLTATSIDYGLWERSSGLGTELSDENFERIRRQGFPALTESDGLALFDAAVASDAAHLVALRIDPAVLRTRAEQAPALVRGLVPASARRETTSPLLGLAGLSAGDRSEALLYLVRSTAATVLGHESVNAIDPQQPFQQLGFDSLTAVELRNKLNASTGLRLPATLVFDHPNPQAVAELIDAKLSGATATGADAVSRVDVAHDAIAVVAMGCRYPGGVTSPEELWDVVASGVDTTGDMPTDRGWDIDAIYDPEPGKAGRTYARRGSFLHGAADFDAEFFGISPNEATATDPQQRLLLEVSWEALERAGLDAAALRGSSTGVFTGLMYHDYARATGTASSSAGSLVSGRLSYVFGLEGPSVTVDTACSSSLVALHLAAQSLRSGECDLALAGGVAVMATPDMFLEFGRQRGLSPDGRCRSFSDDADGVGWSEGAGVLVLERLSDARRNGHEVLAVLAGSAVNQDGASNGLTAPNGPAQQRVIRQALANAGIAATEVDAVEAHGTGTTLGDPIEAQALLATYGRDRAEDRPLWLGSLKSNIGHAQAAAGVAGVIKMIMSMRHGVLPRTLHADQPSTKVDWSEGQVRLLNDSTPWPAANRPRRAAVSSFGLSGTNAHVIVEQAPPVETRPEAPATRSDDGVSPWIVSARSETALSEQAARLVARFDGLDTGEHKADRWDIGFSLASSRAVFDHRAVIVGTDITDLLTGARAMAGDAAVESEASTRVVSGRAVPGSTAFVFSGQGAQWAGMDQQLRAHPAFAETFDAVVAELDPLLDQTISLRDGLADSALADRTVFAQAGLFAFEVALYRLLESWGITADVMAGHSIGEIAAAHVAGVMSLPDACVLVAARARLMQALPAGGSMVAVGASESAVAPLLTDGVSIAAINSPTAVVVSGVETEIDALAAEFVENGWRTNRLRVSHAFHSALVEPMLEEFATAISTVAFGRPNIPLISTVTGTRVDNEMSDPAYWVHQVRATVRFADAVTAMIDAGAVRIAEIGPDSVLTPMVVNTLEAADSAATAVGLARRNRADIVSVMTGAAGLFVSGAAVNWHAVYADSGSTRIELPTYAFQRQRYWMPDGAATGGDIRSLGLAGTGHPLVSAMVSQPDTGAITLTGRLSVRTQPWLADHSVANTVMFPGTGLVDLALTAAAHAECSTLEDLVLYAPLVLPSTEGVLVRVVVGPDGETASRPVRIFSRIDSEAGAASAWSLHAEGSVTPATVAVPPYDADLSEWPPVGAAALPVGDLYDELSTAGYGYGPNFQGLRGAWQRGDEIFAEIALPDPRAAEGFGVHPALFDACLHALLADQSGDTTLALPFEWSGVAIHTAGAGALRVRLTRLGDHSVSMDLADSTGAAVATVRQLTSRPVDPARLAAAANPIDNSMFTIDWVALPVSGDPVDAVAWDELGDDVPAYVTVGAPRADDPESVRAATHTMLGVLQAWVTDPRFTQSVLVVQTSGAVSVAGEPITNLAGAAVGGLVRAAQAESEGRIVLVDTDSELDGLLGAILGTDEPQVAVRERQVYGARLARIAAPPVADAAAPGFGPDETVLITGASGYLGGEFARHLTETHGARHLLLVSRSGENGSGAAQLREDLRALGAEVEFAACDVGDRAALGRVIDAIPSERPLTGVLHAAGVLDDAAIISLTPERIDAVMQPKVDAALHLHELTAELPLKSFVLFSSLAGSFGNVGQGNYAAANACLDAIAWQRKSSGLPGQSLAWGLWDGDGMGGELDARDLDRMARSGLRPLSREQGLALYDAAGRVDVATPILAHLDPQRMSGTGSAAAMVSGLLPARRTPKSASGDQLRSRLANMAEPERIPVLEELVRKQAAATLGYADIELIAVDKVFGEMGFDSITAIEFRNSLRDATGLGLPGTLVFDYPTPQILAKHLDERLADGDTGIATAVRAATERDRAAGVADDSLYGMFRAAVGKEQLVTAFVLLHLAAQTRDQFYAHDELDEKLEITRLTDGAATPRIICIAPPMAAGGVRQYARMATKLRTARDVVGIAPIGSRASEPLPGDYAAATKALHQPILDAAEGKPFILLGFSSGGLLAYSVAEQLEALGGPTPAGVVMVDTYRVVEGGEWLLKPIAENMVTNEAAFDRFDPARLTAMGQYIQVYRSIELGHVAAPTLYLQCTQRMPGVPDNFMEWQAQPWDESHHVVEVDADHFSVLHEGSGRVAAAIDDWLESME